MADAPESPAERVGRGNVPEAPDDVSVDRILAAGRAGTPPDTLIAVDKVIAAVQSGLEPKHAAIRGGLLYHQLKKLETTYPWVPLALELAKLDYQATLVEHLHDGVYGRNAWDKPSAALTKLALAAAMPETYAPNSGPSSFTINLVPNVPQAKRLDELEYVDADYRELGDGQE